MLQLEGWGLGCGVGDLRGFEGWCGSSEALVGVYWVELS